MANELRVRADGVAGALDAALAAGTTALSSPGLADLPAIGATQHAPISLFVRDTDGRVTKREIVWVTAHTAAATTATILRAQEDTTAQAWAIADKWVLGPTRLDLDIELLPTNRPTASYTLVLADLGKAVEMNVAAANTLTVPPNSSVPFPLGTLIEVLQYGAGQTTLTPGAAVTLRSSGAKLKLSVQYASASLRKIGTDEWVVAGDLVA